MIFCWHRTDLRLEDNPALERATELARRRGTTIRPVFVFNPPFYSEGSLACDGRIEFLHECLAGLREQYRERGSELTLLHGTLAERFASLRGRRADRNDREGEVNDGPDTGVRGRQADPA
jgi:deoxyribodipyrimidine photo-lyase